MQNLNRPHTTEKTRRDRQAIGDLWDPPFLPELYIFASFSVSLFWTCIITTRKLYNGDNNLSMYELAVCLTGSCLSWDLLKRAIRKSFPFDCWCSCRVWVWEAQPHLGFHMKWARIPWVPNSQNVGDEEAVWKAVGTVLCISLCGLSVFARRWTG